MKLEGLKALYKDMKDKKIERYKIQFSFHGVAFDVFFFIDENPFILMFGVKVENFYFEVQVKSGFEVNPIFDEDTYQELMKILNLSYDPNNPFKPKYFFEEFNKKIPQKVISSDLPEPQEVAAFRRNVEENQKIYFFGWKDNNKTDENVSPENLRKTKLLLGEVAYERCKKKNISSKWTDKEHLALKFNLPN